jgi:hypothetical protein
MSVYVDDINIIGNKYDINEARHHLTEFEMKVLGETKLCRRFYKNFINIKFVTSTILLTFTARRNSSFFKKSREEK